MSTGEPDSSADLSVEDMRVWLAQELKDLDKLRELRAKQAIGIVESYAKGELSPGEASVRLSDYEYRWGDALPGTHAMSHMSNDDILGRIDKARVEEDTIYDELRQRAGPPSGRSRQTQ